MGLPSPARRGESTVTGGPVIASDQAMEGAMPTNAPADGSARLLRGAGLASQLRSEIAESIAELTGLGAPSPRLVTVLVGDNPSALAYRASIARTMSRVGIAHEPLDLDPAISATSFARELHALSADPLVTGILVLMPLPAAIPMAAVYEHLLPLKDVDGITPVNAGRLHLGLPALHPSTPQGGIELLQHYDIPIAGQHAVVVGRSSVVGKPLASLLLSRDATVTTCHRATPNLAELTRQGDIVAVAAGSPGLLHGDMVRPGATVIDFGVNVVDGGIVGDACFDELVHVAGAITPVPGGTGPVTALVLARNTVAAGFALHQGSLDSLASSISRLACT